uniref:Uncharacterized protein n=1 Tax=uncultured bacterium A1Q1_fos_2140 TaxID=1256565 RepID=L7VXT5_9BACT|nr:hypothetical protein [uncultured bacterium A1Q1_fos_2140]
MFAIPLDSLDEFTGIGLDKTAVVAFMQGLAKFWIFIGGSVRQKCRKTYTIKIAQYPGLVMIKFS